MIQQESIVIFSDNSGILRGRVIKPRPNKRRFALVGDSVTIVVTAIHRIKKENVKITGGKVKRIPLKTKHKALFITSKYPTTQFDGSVIRFTENCVILNKGRVIKGMRLYSVAIATRVTSILANRFLLLL
jgi:ribosomal protein L14